MPLDDTGAYATAYYEAMSPSLLAAQPTTASKPDAKLGDDWDEIFPRLEARLGSLRTWRFTWWAYWADLARAILPRRFHWLVVANNMNRGLPINDFIVDSTATLAMNICGAGMWTGLTSPSRPWFKLGVLNPGVALDAAGQEWLEDTETLIYTVLGESNFYTVMAQAFQDVATFGTAPVVVYEDYDDVVRCYLPCAGEYYLAVGARLSVDTFYREFNLTVQDIVEMFGFDNCPPEVQQLWVQGTTELEYTVAHCIEPNTALLGKYGRKQIRVVPGRFTYREMYWLKGKQTPTELSRRGFTEKPFFAARWSTVSNDAYGRSPGMDCLGDTKQLQQETRRKGEFIEKLVRPPMGADLDMKNEPSSILPGHITYTNTNGKKGFWPLFEMNPAAMAPMVQDITEIQQRIQRCFFVDVFMAITNMEGVQPRNELELTKRDLERLQQLGPFITLFGTECATPAIQRVLAILERRRMLRPKPPSLHGQSLKITLVSILALAQAAAETASMEKTMAVAGNAGAAAQAAGLPNPIRIINWDETLREYAERVNFPAKGLYSSQQVAEHDQIRTQAQQQQMALQATQPAVEAAQTLSKTPIGGGQTALSAMLGTAGGAPPGAGP